MHTSTTTALVALVALVSYKVVDRVFEHSAASGADRLALVAVAHRAHQDGVLADPRWGVAELAAMADIDPKTFGRAAKRLATRGEMVYLSAPGRDRVPVCGVTVGLDEADAAEVIRAAERHAARLGGRFMVYVAEPVAAALGLAWEGAEVPAPELAKWGRLVTISWDGARKNGDGSSRNGDIWSRNGDGSSPFPSYKGFFPVSRSPEYNNNTAGESGGGGGSSAPPSGSVPPRPEPLTPDESRARDGLLALGVYEIPAERIARMEPAWVSRVLAAGRAMQRRGQTKALGAVVVAMADGKQPLPELGVGAPPTSRRPDQVLHELPPELQERYDEITTTGGDWHADAELSSALTKLLIAA